LNDDPIGPGSMCGRDCCQFDDCECYSATLTGNHFPHYKYGGQNYLKLPASPSLYYESVDIQFCIIIEEVSANDIAELAIIASGLGLILFVFISACFISHKDPRIPPIRPGEKLETPMERIITSKELREGKILMGISIVQIIYVLMIIVGNSFLVPTMTYITLQVIVGVILATFVVVGFLGVITSSSASLLIYHIFLWFWSILLIVYLLFEILFEAMFAVTTLLVLFVFSNLTLVGFNIAAAVMSFKIRRYIIQFRITSLP